MAARALTVRRHRRLPERVNGLVARPAWLHERLREFVRLVTILAALVTACEEGGRQLDAGFMARVTRLARPHGIRRLCVLVRVTALASALAAVCRVLGRHLRVAAEARRRRGRGVPMRLVTGQASLAFGVHL